MALACTPENFRAEMARHLLYRRDVAGLIKLSPNRFTDYVNGTLPLTDWAAHNIGYGINQVTGHRLFDVDEERGVVKPPRGRPPGTYVRGLGLDPYVRQRTRRRHRSVD